MKNAPALTHADTVPVRLAAERRHRLDIQGARGRLRFSRASDERLDHDLRHAATRRQLVLNLDAAPTREIDATRPRRTRDRARQA